MSLQHRNTIPSLTAKVFSSLPPDNGAQHLLIYYLNGRAQLVWCLCRHHLVLHKVPLESSQQADSIHLHLYNPITAPVKHEGNMLIFHFSRKSFQQLQYQFSFLYYGDYITQTTLLLIAFRYYIKFDKILQYFKMEITIILENPQKNLPLSNGK